MILLDLFLCSLEYNGMYKESGRIQCVHLHSTRCDPVTEGPACHSTCSGTEVHHTPGCLICLTVQFPCKYLNPEEWGISINVLKGTIYVNQSKEKMYKFKHKNRMNEQRVPDKHPSSDSHNTTNTDSYCTEWTMHVKVFIHSNYET
jgi:hypothetical protein